MTLDLTPLFDPKGVVVAGASTHPGKFGFMTLHNILAGGYEGAVFATNPERPEILGIRCHAAVAEIPSGSADLVMVCAPTSAIPTVLRESAERGIRAAFVISGGFGEVGEEGREAERRLVSLARDLGMVVAGPNGQGLVSTPAKLWSQFVAPYPPAGGIAIASQSGNIGSTVMNLARQADVGVSRAISAGNQAMLSIADYVRHLADDEHTAVIVVYVEGVDDGRAFYNALRYAMRRKPVIVIKGGTTVSGAAAAASHTGALASDDRVFDGMLRQAGALRAPGVDVAYSWAAAFSTQPLPRGPRTVVLTSAGGWGVLTADAIARSSLELIDLPADLHDAMDELLPPRWSRRNPVDVAGGETRDTIPVALDTIAAHPDVDAVVYLGLGIQGNGARGLRESPFANDDTERMASFHERQEQRYAQAAVDAAVAHGKPVIVASELGTADPQNPGPARLRELGWACHATPTAGIDALDAMWRYADRQADD